jgi:hypothetical protein
VRHILAVLEEEVIHLQVQQQLMAALRIWEALVVVVVEMIMVVATVVEQGEDLVK